MNHLVKLMLAITVGVVAAGLNWLYLSSQATPSDFVAFKEDVKRGEQITLDLLQPVAVPGELDELRKTFIPYDERQILDGQTATREYRAGDIVFHRDLAAPETTTQYEELGPFRLISVGSRFAASVKQEDSVASGTDDTITIAVPWPYDKQTRRLMDITRAQRAADAKEGLTAKIDRVLVFPAAGTEVAGPEETTDISLGLAENERAAFISLDGIANVPRVLQVGQRIGFVILNDAPTIVPAAAADDTSSTAAVE